MARIDSIQCRDGVASCASFRTCARPSMGFGIVEGGLRPITPLAGYNCLAPETSTCRLPFTHSSLTKAPNWSGVSGSVSAPVS